ncbi:aspartate/glutamate racemase family protein [Qingshengfaniella alkalisoli]|uniref:Ectoine utilization protein EutA n=1 Tax=Qingshengfaniella alkalisoli TaxID=2599296 RepID=A0A5B8IA74_9RHOB|nr:aspartate/glutamate racemase family protein [Qingshengfaniella alkalisoli]QDY70096.1 ectoine utilization protein EutA [Qingshengfaniella alkalisoli]
MPASHITVATQPPELTAEDITRFGLIALSTDLTIEGDARRVLPDDVALHVNRIEFANPTTPENLAAMAPRLTQAASLVVPDQPLAAIGFGCTSGSAVIGDAEMDHAVAVARPGVPLVTPARAARQAFDELGARRIAVMTPYLPETTAALNGYFESHGVNVVRAHCLGIGSDQIMGRITYDSIVEAAVSADVPEADAVFLSCTSLPAMPVIERIEARIGKPVLSSNQVTFWAMLRAAGLTARPGYGCLLARLKEGDDAA